jgi:hypothetical protein
LRPETTQSKSRKQKAETEEGIKGQQGKRETGKSWSLRIGVAGDINVHNQRGGNGLAVAQGLESLQFVQVAVELAAH